MYPFSTEQQLYSVRTVVLNGLDSCLNTGCFESTQGNSGAKGLNAFVSVWCIASSMLGIEVLYNAPRASLWVSL
jgi:hypothetical protein